MIESTAQKNQTLAIAGETLSFLAVGAVSAFTIKGLYGFSLTRLYGGTDSVYTVEKQKFTFQVTVEDFKAHSLANGKQFTITDGTYVYKFEISTSYPDTVGWMIMSCDFIGRT